MHTTEILAGYTFDRLLEEAEKTRRRRLPPRTLQNWLARLSIERDQDGFYSEEDLELIRGLIRHLRRPKNTIEQYVEHLKEIYRHAS